MSSIRRGRNDHEEKGNHHAQCVDPATPDIGIDDAQKLARGLQAALDKVNMKKG